MSRYRASMPFLLAVIVSVALATNVRADVWISSTALVQWNGECSPPSNSGKFDDFQSPTSSTNCTKLNPCSFPQASITTKVQGSCIIHIMQGDYLSVHFPYWYPSFSDNTSVLSIMLGEGSPKLESVSSTVESKVEHLHLVLSVKKSGNVVPNIQFSGALGQVPVVLSGGRVDLYQSLSSNFSFSALNFKSNLINFVSDKLDQVVGPNDVRFSQCRFEYQDLHALSISNPQNRSAEHPLQFTITQSTMVGDSLSSTFMSCDANGVSLVIEGSSFIGSILLNASTNVDLLVLDSSNFTSNATSLVKCKDFGVFKIQNSASLHTPRGGAFYVFPQSVPKKVGQELPNLVWMSHVELERVVLRGALPVATLESDPGIQNLTCRDCHLDLEISKSAKLVSVHFSILSEIGGFRLTRTALDQHSPNTILELDMYVNETQQSRKPFIFADSTVPPRPFDEWYVNGLLKTNMVWLQPPIKLQVGLEISQLIEVTDARLGRPTLSSSSNVTLNSIQVNGVDLGFVALPKLYYNVTNPALGIATTPGGNTDAVSFRITEATVAEITWEVATPPDIGTWYPFTYYANAKPNMVSLSTFEGLDLVSSFDEKAPNAPIMYCYLPHNFTLPPNPLPCVVPPANFTCVRGYFIAFKPIDTETIVFPSNPAIAYANITASKSITFVGYQGVERFGLNSTECIKTSSFVLNVEDMAPKKSHLPRHVVIAQQNPNCPSIWDVPLSVKQNPNQCDKVTISRVNDLSSPSRIIALVSFQPCNNEWKWIALGVLSGLLVLAAITLVVSLYVSRYRLRKMTEKGYAPIQ